MPEWTPEGDIPFPMDDERRSLWKWCQRLYDVVGSITAGCPFPEGTIPLPGDDEERLYQKINRMLEGPRPDTFYTSEIFSEGTSSGEDIEIV